jgi:hypothetical protein
MRQVPNIYEDMQLLYIYIYIYFLLVKENMNFIVKCNRSVLCSVILDTFEFLVP